MYMNGLLYCRANIFDWADEVFLSETKNDGRLEKATIE